MKKALLISDIHGSYRILSSLIEHFRMDKQIGMMIFAGDAVDMGEPVSFIDELIWTIEQLGWQLIWVPGNNDFGRAYHRLNAKVKSVEGRILDSDGHKYTGVGGSPASWSGQYQGERSVDKKEIAGTIFLSHVPPPGISSYKKTDDANPKFEIRNPKQIQNSNLENSKIVPHTDGIAPKAVISNLELRASNLRTIVDCPLVHICGHVHHTWGIGYLGTTKVIKLAGAYLGYYAIMDLDSLKVEFGRLWK